MCSKELSGKRFWVATYTEFQTTLLFVLIATGSAMYTSSTLHIALTFGFAIAVLVHATAHISGGHLNPAVTIAMAITGRISILRGLFYVAAQCGGAVAASAILDVITPDNVQGNLAADELQSNISQGAGFIVEFVITWQFVMTVFASTDKDRNDPAGYPAIAIGLSIAIGHLFAIGYTNCGMNPARSLGPAVISGFWEDHWIFWAAPISAGMLAGLQYELLLAPSSSVKRLRSYVKCKQRSQYELDNNS